MKLTKELSLLGVFSITAGAMISSGLFILPGLAYNMAGPAVILSYLLAGLLATTGMLSQAELASAMPKAGGAYFFVNRSMGPAVGTVYGLITFLALALKSAFQLVGIVTILGLFFSTNMNIVAVALALLFVGVNLLGTKKTGRLQVVLVLSILVALVVYVALGQNAIEAKHFDPLVFNGVEGIFAAAGFVFVSYGGLLKVASVSEEVKDPGRTVPLGMILALIVIGLFYVAVIFVTIGIMDGPTLATSLSPISDAAFAALGMPGKIALSIVGLMAISSAANAAVLGASRYPLALARDKLIPSVFGRINRRYKTPHVAILVTGIIMIVSLFLDVKVIVKAASSVLILTYIFSCLALIIMRESRLQNYRPSFVSPLYPWIQIVGIMGFIFLLYQIGPEALAVSAMLIMGGLFVYFFYGRERSESQYALLHLIERITARELADQRLEEELKEIIRERDEIVADRFDQIIENAVVLDVEECVGVDDFFRLVADRLTDRLHMTCDDLMDSLLAREEDSSTALTPSLAIPHVIIDGEHNFDILLARSRPGVHFSKDASHVHAMFFLIGTRDERNFHLQALSSIAQIVMDPDFEQRWMAAKNESGLRDVVLLGQRRRS